MKNKNGRIEKICPLKTHRIKKGQNDIGLGDDGTDLFCHGVLQEVPVHPVHTEILPTIRGESDGTLLSDLHGEFLRIFFTVTAYIFIMKS